MLWVNNVLPPATGLLEQWGCVVKNWDQFSKKRSFVADLVRKGLPDEFRPLVWRLYTGAYDSTARKLYDGYLEVESPVENAIRRDIARTFPKHELFKDENGSGQERLFRVIKAYSVHDREVGYCQGSGFITGLLLMQLPELDAFAVLVQLMNEYRLREIYKPAMVELGVCMYQLEQLLAEHLPEIYTHFVSHSFAPSLYASAWFLTLFSTVLPINMAIRVMDFFIIEGMNFIFRLALSLLKFSAEKLLASDMETMVVYLQNEGPAQWEQNASAIFEAANAIKLNPKKMKKLEKEYLQMRSQEREDQIELRRLRTENGLLLQRIARLEEECASVADRLVQSQLIRAQESEALLALRCELSILRRTHMKPTAGTSSVCQNGETSEENRDPGDEKAESRDQSTSSHDSEPRSISLTQLTGDFGVLRINGTADPVETVASFVNGPCSPTERRSREPSVAELEVRDQYPTYPSLPSSMSSQATGTVNPPEIVSYSQARHATLPRQATGFTPKGDDTLAVTTLHTLQSDLTLCRAREADAKSTLSDLKIRYHELEELKTDQATRSAEQMAVLKDELFTVKLRETEALTRLDEMRQRLAEIEALWQAHSSRCKVSTSDGKRTSLLLGSFGQSGSSDARKLSDGILEARYLEQIATLQQQVNELAVQRELADRRADRLDQRITELLEARSAAGAREHELRSELKEAVQMCAEIEAKRKADGLMWRSREMELTAQLTEWRQCQLQLECKYESLLATRHLQAVPPSPISCRGDSKCNGFNSTDTIDSVRSAQNLDNLLSLNLRQLNGSSDSLDTQDDMLTSGDVRHRTLTASSNPPQPHPKTELRSLWKDLPPTVMTDSIGPLEDLCLVPDDPMITSVYLGNGTSYED
ncbi:ecotropic viral integration site [Clonorchis sinensis]|uniref:TBC1 domain family member CG11727 n=2 Tax=Clonorchis sinensis TaxID=79923 RepID=G7Y4P5_CLOSI|nr:ecotropic viral integration site [Clonorchis sinensis]GAA47931.1 TBC1 domain family member CG11727 [Clonorchis sinensis]